MEENLIRATPDKERAKSIVAMVNTTLELIRTIDANRFPSNVVKEYYDILRELLSAILLLDGFKTQGEGAHKKLIEYLDKHYEQFSEHDIALLDELRITMNRISYDGFFIQPDYLERNSSHIKELVTKLKELANNKLDSGKRG